MDIATIIGFLATFGLIVMAMGDPAPFIDMPSFYIVVLGTLTAVLARSSIPEFVGSIGVALKTVKYKLWPKASSAKTCITASMCCPVKPQRCVTARSTCSTCCSTTPYNTRLQGTNRFVLRPA
jgi:hypothetical protein